MLPKGFVPLAPGPGPAGTVPGDDWTAPGRPVFLAMGVRALAPGGLFPFGPKPLDVFPRWVMYGGPFDSAQFAAIRDWLVAGWRARGIDADVRRVPVAPNGTGGVLWPWQTFRWCEWQQESAPPVRWRYRPNLGNTVAWEQAPSGVEVAGLFDGLPGFSGPLEPPKATPANPPPQWSPTPTEPSTKSDAGLALMGLAVVGAVVFHRELGL